MCPFRAGVRDSDPRMTELRKSLAGSTKDYLQSEMDALRKYDVTSEICIEEQLTCLFLRQLQFKVHVNIMNIKRSSFGSC